jgi:hypothetical protein
MVVNAADTVNKIRINRAVAVKGTQADIVAADSISIMNAVPAKYEALDIIIKSDGGQLGVSSKKASLVTRTFSPMLLPVQ